MRVLLMVALNVAPHAAAMGHAALRRGRRSIAGQVYLVTFTTAGRAGHFGGWEMAADASRILGAAASWAPSRLLAWVLMPDHFHGLVQLSERDALGQCVGRVKGTIARSLRAGHPGIGRIWDRGFHDRALRAEADVRAAARYLVGNPLRAGLVDRMGDYPFWDAAWLRSNEPL